MVVLREVILAHLGYTRRHGDSPALVIDRAVFELLGIDQRTSLEISTDGRALVIVPARGRRRPKRFQEAPAACNRQYGEAIKRLAD